MGRFRSVEIEEAWPEYVTEITRLTQSFTSSFPESDEPKIKAIIALLSQSAFIAGSECYDQEDLDTFCYRLKVFFEDHMRSAYEASSMRR